MQKVSTNAQAKPAKRKSISYDKYGYYFVAPFFIVFLIFRQKSGGKEKAPKEKQDDIPWES